MSHLLNGDDAFLVKFKRQQLEREVGKAAIVRAWAVLNGEGDFLDVFYMVGCSLCRSALQGYNPDELVSWWKAHYPMHAVEVNRNGRRHSDDGGDGPPDGQIPGTGGRGSQG